MIRLIAVAFALAVVTSAQAMSPAPLHQPDGMITQVREACGAGRVRINGVCVARTTKRQVRRCARWNGGTCVRWY
jgi:putative N-acetylmannosamine-6-phosphate epimerase